MPDSRDFSTVLVKDDRLMISDTISYGVQKRCAADICRYLRSNFGISQLARL